jgi:hypothetical protein
VIFDDEFVVSASTIDCASDLLAEGSLESAWIVMNKSWDKIWIDLVLCDFLYLLNKDA